MRNRLVVKSAGCSVCRETRYCVSPLIWLGLKSFAPYSTCPDNRIRLFHLFITGFDFGVLAQHLFALGLVVRAFAAATARAGGFLVALHQLFSFVSRQPPAVSRVKNDFVFLIQSGFNAASDFRTALCALTEKRYLPRI